MNDVEDVRQGEKLLTAVERILADTGSLIAYADTCVRHARDAGGDTAAVRKRAAREAITHYSNLTALSGGAAALPALVPALVPGLGTAVAVAGGAAADMGFMLKFEIEMALVLTRIHGYDIRDEAERKLAFLLASISTYDAKSDGNFLVDVMKAESVAVWNYTPRQVSKILLTVLTRLMLRQVSKGFLRAVPLVGIAVGSSVNKALTTRVGERCARELEHRRLTQPGAAPPDADVVDAHVRS
jgi:uncharacterized protein (DUF697 family)